MASVCELERAYTMKYRKEFGPDVLNAFSVVRGFYLQKNA